MAYKYVSQSIFSEPEENLCRLAELFPAVVKDKQVDFAALREVLGQFEELTEEKYELTWAGKRYAKRAAQSDVYGRTLKYVSQDSKDPETTQNIYIEGDNLEVLKILRQNYHGAVKVIYIDPPYNTGNDFLYRDSFTMSRTESDEAEGETVDGERMVINQRSSNRYHANWLNMIYPRLHVARDLLRDDGVIIVNMDEHEIANLQKVCTEIFGDGNELGTIIWDKRNPKGDARGISYQHEYIVMFAKNKESFLASCKMLRPKKNAHAMLKKAEQIFRKIGLTFTLGDANQEFQVWVSAQKELSGGEAAYKYIDANGDVYRPVSMAWPNNKKAPDEYFIPLIHPITGKPCPVPAKGWRNSSATMKELMDRGLIIFGKDENTQPNRKYLLKDNIYENIPSLLYYGGSDTDMLAEMGIPFDTPKAVSIVKEHLLSFTSADDIVLDFFSGSATTAQAVMQLNAENSCNLYRKFIMVQIREDLDINYEKAPRDEKTFIKKAIDFLDSIGKPHNVSEIGKERIRRAGEKIRAEIEAKNAQLKYGEEPIQIPDTGFKVFRTADTNIRWTRQALKQGEISPYYSPLTDKDKLDFMPGFTDIDVVYEILLRQRGIPLSAKVEKIGIGERTYRFADAYVVCLDNKITSHIVAALAAIKPTPIKYVLRDSGFDDDIAFKDETIRRLEAYIARNSGGNKKAYTVEFL